MSATRLTTVARLGKPCDFCGQTMEKGSQVIVSADRARGWHPACAPDTDCGLMTIGGLLNKCKEPPVWAITGRATVGSIVMLSGRPGSGKTSMLRTFALAAARGETWLGHEIKPGPVLFLACEGNLADIKDDFEAAGAQYGDPLYIFDGEGIGKDPIPWLEAIVTKHKIKYVIFDTLQRFIKISGERSGYADVSNVTDAFIRLSRKTAVTQLWNFHNRKLDKRTPDAVPTLDDVMDSSAWTGAADAVFLAWKRVSGEFFIRSDKQRAGKCLDARQVTMDERTRLVSIGDSVTEMTFKKARQALEACALRQIDGFTRLGLITESGVRKSDCYAAMDSLTEDGTFVVESGKGLKGSPYQYRHRDVPTPEGRREAKLLALVQNEATPPDTRESAKIQELENAQI